MTKGRDKVAESLSDVIEFVHRRKQSGLLSVERMQGSRFEEGEIHFQAGQPTYAHTGQMMGQEALVWMLSWRQVHFTFLAGELRPPAHSSAVAANDRGASSGNSATQSSPSLSSDGRSIPATSISPRLPQVSTRKSFNEGGMSPVQNAVNSTSSTPGLEWLVPQKLGKNQDVLSLPLTRPQRSIYLLVDGRRTVSDLARCTRKSLQEIERLLNELQERNLVVI